MKSQDKWVNLNLVLFARTYLCGSFILSLYRISFRHYLYKRMGFIDNNYFSESENSALSRNSSGPKSNNKLYVSGDKIMNHQKKRYCQFM